MRLQFEAIGTQWEIGVPALPESVSEQQVSEVVSSRIDAYDRTYSRFRPDSWVSNVRQPGKYQLPHDSKPLLNLYQKLYAITEGAFTPLIGNALEQVGYDASYSLQPKQITPIPLWDDAIRADGELLEIKKPVVLDFGAAGKGYLVDIVASDLEELGVASYCIDAGGDILYKGKNPLQVGLEHPEKFDEVIGVVNLVNASLCGSSGNRRRWGGYHHIINPHTRISPTNVLATWVIAESGLLADGLATALFLTEARALRPHFSFEYVIVYKDYALEKSSSFPGEIYTK